MNTETSDGDEDVKDDEAGNPVADEEQLRTDHELVQVLNSIPEERMAEISKRSVMLRRYIKVPLLIFILGTSLQSGFTTVILKIVDTFIQTGMYK